MLNNITCRTEPYSALAVNGSLQKAIGELKIELDGNYSEIADLKFKLLSSEILKFENEEIKKDYEAEKRELKEVIQVLENGWETDRLKLSDLSSELCQLQNVSTDSLAVKAF